jgi:transposase-like protein
MLQTDLNSFSYKKGSLVPWCKRCEAQHWYRDGKNKEGMQRYRCRNCGFRFVWSSDMPNRRVFSHIVTFAVKLYTDLRKAISLRGIAELLKEIFGVVVSHEAVRKWIRVAKKTLYRRRLQQYGMQMKRTSRSRVVDIGYGLYTALTHITFWGGTLVILICLNMLNMSYKWRYTTITVCDRRKSLPMVCGSIPLLSTK